MLFDLACPKCQARVEFELPGRGETRILTCPVCGEATPITVTARW